MKQCLLPFALRLQKDVRVFRADAWTPDNVHSAGWLHTNTEIMITEIAERHYDHRWHRMGKFFIAHQPYWVILESLETNKPDTRPRRSHLRLVKA